MRGPMPAPAPGRPRPCARVRPGPGCGRRCRGTPALPALACRAGSPPVARVRAAPRRGLRAALAPSALCSGRGCGVIGLRSPGRPARRCGLRSSPLACSGWPFARLRRRRVPLPGPPLAAPPGASPSLLPPGGGWGRPGGRPGISRRPRAWDTHDFPEKAYNVPTKGEFLHG